MNDKIFVSIASYRDPELIPTVNSLLKCADNPENLRIVVFEQNDITDPSIVGKYNQVEVISTHYKNAKGPTHARYIIQQKYNNEKYYLQIDSHMRVIPHWDSILIHILELVPQPAVLTQYPPEYDLNKNTLDTTKIRSGLYIQGFGITDKFTRIQSDRIKYENRRFFPYTSKGWSACFSFSYGNIVKDAPYKNYEYLFFGEELDITLRLYTRGYYFFSPHVTVIFTIFKRNHRRTYWQDIPQTIRKDPELVSRNQLWKNILQEIDMGNVRTVADYMNFAQIQKWGILKKNAKSFRRYTKRLLRR